MKSFFVLFFSIGMFAIGKEKIPYNAYVFPKDLLEKKLLIINSYVPIGQELVGEQKVLPKYYQREVQKFYTWQLNAENREYPVISIDDLHADEYIDYGYALQPVEIPIVSGYGMDRKITRHALSFVFVDLFSYRTFYPAAKSLSADYSYSHGSLVPKGINKCFKELKKYLKHSENGIEEALKKQWKIQNRTENIFWACIYSSIVVIPVTAGLIDYYSY